MGIHVLLTVDLNRRVSDDARERFNDYLKEQKWVKLKLTITWHARFTEGTPAEVALRVTKADVRNAAALAGVSNYEAAAQAGTTPPTMWNQTG